MDTFLSINPGDGMERTENDSERIGPVKHCTLIFCYQLKSSPLLNALFPHSVAFLLTVFVQWDLEFSPLWPWHWQRGNHDPWCETGDHNNFNSPNKEFPFCCKQWRGSGFKTRQQSGRGRQRYTERGEDRQKDQRSGNEIFTCTHFKTVSVCISGCQTL